LQTILNDGGVEGKPGIAIEGNVLGVDGLAPHFTGLVVYLVGYQGILSKATVETQGVRGQAFLVEVGVKEFQALIEGRSQVRVTDGFPHQVVVVLDRLHLLDAGLGATAPVPQSGVGASGKVELEHGRRGVVDA